MGEDGRRGLGGHLLRLAGLQLLASSGLRLYQVELMARWKSSMILHYAQTAPLTGITHELSDTVARQNFCAQPDTLNEEMSALRKQAVQALPVTISRVRSKE